MNVQPGQMKSKTKSNELTANFQGICSKNGKELRPLTKRAAARSNWDFLWVFL